MIKQLEKIFVITLLNSLYGQHCRGIVVVTVSFSSGLGTVHRYSGSFVPSVKKNAGSRLYGLLRQNYP